MATCSRVAVFFTMIVRPAGKHVSEDESSGRLVWFSRLLSPPPSFARDDHGSLLGRQLQAHMSWAVHVGVLEFCPVGLSSVSFALGLRPIYRSSWLGCRISLSSQRYPTRSAIYASHCLHYLLKFQEKKSSNAQKSCVIALRLDVLIQPNNFGSLAKRLLTYSFRFKLHFI